jgi:predicted alpha/beta hydrolase
MRATIEDWGTHDADAVLGWARERYAGLPLVVMGHSMGGQIMGMAYRSIHAEALITVATQSAYWRFYRGLFGLYVAWMWWVQIPLLTRLLGYYPGRRLGLGMDLPAGVARQWARWGRDPKYLAGRHPARTLASYAEIDQPMLSVWIADDEVAPREAHDAMVDLYENADHHRFTLDPRDLGLKKIGHFGFFRPHVGNLAWPKLLLWIERVTGKSGRGGSGSRFDRAA